MAGLPQPGADQRSQSKFIVFENFEKMNTQSVRQALSEKELAWLENLQPIAPNNLTTVPAVAAAALATIAQNISLKFYADLGGTDYIIAFTTAGSAWSVNVGTGATSKFAADGTFSGAPDVTTWQASRILINDATSGYCTYDGTLFVKQGGVSPNIVVTSGGIGYSSPPAVTISGGSGAGATATSAILAGQVISVTLTNPGTGYIATDILVVTFGAGSGSGATAHATMSGSGVASVTVTNGGGYFTPPTISFSGGGGSGAAAIPIMSGAAVVAVTITNQGSGYTSPPTVTFSPGPGGLTATGTATLVGQSVTGLVLDLGGAGYGGAPGLIISGGGGSGATGHTTIAAGSVNAVILDTGGNGYQNAPNVTITSGQGAAAQAHVWPFVPKGSTLAVFQGRVWLGGNQLLQWTGTGATYGNVGYDDFLTQDASGSLLVTDADLVHAITALRALNNYLFIMGDQSVKQIGNISLNSAGNVTLFTILTLSSDQGTIYPRACISYNRVFMFVNRNGIFGVFGSSVQKLSSDLDGIFKLLSFTQVPQGAVVDLNGIHNAVFLVRYVDPLSTTRSILLTFDGKKWFVAAQGNGLTAIVSTSTLASGVNSLYGSSGTDVTQLFANAAGTVTFKLQTSLTHHGNAVQRKKVVRAGFAAALASGTGNITQAIDSENASQSAARALAAGFQVLGFGDSKVNVSGKYLGQTLTGTLSGLTLTDVLTEYQEEALWG